MAPVTQFDALCKQAKRAIRTKDYARAIDLYQQALKINPSQTAVHEGLATAYFLSEDFPKAAEHFQEITKLDRWHAQAYVNLGAVYNRMHEYKKATEVLQQAVQRNSRSAEAFYNMAIAHRHLGQPSMAVSAYREAIRLSPEMVDAHVNLANVYREMGNHNQALAHYQKALEIKPKFDRALRGLQKTEKAITEFRRQADGFSRILGETDQEADEAHDGQAAPDSLSTLSTGHLPPEWNDICKIVVKVIEHGRKMLDQMETHLNPTLEALNRTCVRATDPQEKVVARHDEVHRAIERCLMVSRLLESNLDEIREYEPLFKEHGEHDGEVADQARIH